MSEATLEMKNATKHADALKSFAKKLIKQQEIPELVPTDALTAIVRSAFSYDTTDAKAEEAMKVIGVEFVDLNELRVATELEVVEMIGNRISDVEVRVSQCITVLNAIFAREHSLSMDRIKALPKREIRAFLRELPGMHPFIEGYTTLYAFEGNAFPIDDNALSALKDEGIVEDETTLEEAQKFVERELKDDEYKFFWALRHKKKK